MHYYNTTQPFPCNKSQGSKLLGPTIITSTHYVKSLFYFIFGIHLIAPHNKTRGMIASCADVDHHDPS